MHHDWGDESFDWNALNNAINSIYEFSMRWARLGVHVKEKYGTARYNVWVFDGTFHSLWKPGHVFCRYKRPWMSTVDYKQAKLWRRLGIVGFIADWQTAVFATAVRRAADMYPHILGEIVDDCHVPTLVGADAVAAQRAHWRRDGDIPTWHDEMTRYGKRINLFVWLLGKISRRFP